MPPHGQRHRLVLYTLMLNRWWKYTLSIGTILLVIAAGLAIVPLWLPQFHFMWMSDIFFGTFAGAGVYAIVLSIFLISIRKLAYVQPFDTHLRLVTPFLQMNISYRRILRASSVEMLHLFPAGRYRGTQQKILLPLANETAIVLELRGWPLPRWILRLFLSPLFFPDKSSRLALLVPKWMDFSIDLENFRSTWLDSLHGPGGSAQSDLLASISRTKR